MLSCILSRLPCIVACAMLKGMKTMLLTLALTLIGCAQATSQPRTPSAFGRPSTMAALDAAIDTPGEWTIETVRSADWVVDRAGLVSLEHPKAKAAGLGKGGEPISLYFHALRHSRHGLFLVDSGVERAFRDAPKRALIRGMTSKVAHLEKMTVRQPLGDWLAGQSSKVSGVWLTHLHLDHVLGLRDVASDVPIFVGAGDAEARSFENTFTSGVFDEALATKAPLREWTLDSGVADVFGDGSVWAIAVPGHTAGSTAFVVRTSTGPVLLTGDACHTRWGWENGVEPGEFSSDRPASARSLEVLRGLVERHPSIDVRLGHQPLR